MIAKGPPVEIPTAQDTFLPKSKSKSECASGLGSHSQISGIAGKTGRGWLREGARQLGSTSKPCLQPTRSSNGGLGAASSEDTAEAPHLKAAILSAF